MKLKAWMSGLMAIGGVLALGGSANGASVGDMLAGKCLTSGGTLVYQSGHFMNDHTTDTLVVQCPLPMPSTATIKSADFTVFDRTTTDKVSCNLTVATTILANGNFSGPAGSIDSGAAWASNDVKTMNADVPDTAAGYVFATCTVPPKTGGQRSGLVAVKVNY